MENKHSHEHSHGTKETVVLYFVGLVLYIIGLTIYNEPIVFILALFLSGYHIIYEGFADTINSTIESKKFKPNVHLLMTLSAIGAIIIKEYSEAALLILIFAGAHYLEDYASSKSNKEITNLLKLNPTTARRLNDDGSIEIVDVSTLVIGDKLRVLNGDQIATDGIIIEGSSSIDQSAITGESIPVEVSVDSEVYGGTINGLGTFNMVVTKDSSETVFAKIIELVSQTQSNVSKTAAFIQRVEPIYVTIALILTPVFFLVAYYGLSLTVYESFYRTMVFMIGVSPCALAVTDIPATLSAISNLAKQKVLFKGGSFLSNFSDVNVIAFDKTGTLTEGKPTVSNEYFVSDNKEEIIQLLVSMESASNHPLANAILSHYGDVEKLPIEVKNITGVGLAAKYKGSNYNIGKPKSFENVDQSIIDIKDKYEMEGKTVVYFSKDNEIQAVIAILDQAKESAKRTLKYFEKENVKTVMITGDAKKTAVAIGNTLNVSEVIADVMPEDKSNIIERLRADNNIVAMVGDGINDAPALVASDIGFAMGSGTDIAIDAADAVLMQNDLDKIAYTHRLSKRLRKIVIQNIVFAMAIVVILVVLNITGNMDISLAVLIHEGSTLVVILNGLRLLKKID